MHANEQCIRNFYAAFAKRDAEGMATCYHPDIAFTDPAFPMLRGEEASAMWAMLTSRAKDDFEIILVEASYNSDSNAVDAEGGRAKWEAKYTFTQTGRKVHNKIDAAFAFRDGKIIRHVDRFPFWTWARQALGPVGLLLGWSLPIKAVVRKKAKAALAQFMERGKYPKP